MVLRALLALLRIRHRWARYQLVRDIERFVRLHFLYAAVDSGLLEALRAAASKDELIAKLQVRRPELLDVLLEMGVALKELAFRDGRYRLAGRRSRALVAEDGDPLVAMIQELATYHASAYRHVADRLRGAEPGDYLKETGTLIARSSRVLEPFVGNFVRVAVGTGRPLRMLEVGCGSGIYLRYAVEANPGVSGVAIDMQGDVVEHAKANLQTWGIAASFSVLAADVRKLPPDISGPFDLVTLYNNVYYFDPAGRTDLFRRLRALLASDGSLAVVSLMQGRSLTALDLDLALRSTAGCWALPALDELTAQLKESGFARVKTMKLLPGEPLYGLLARVEHGAAASDRS